MAAIRDTVGQIGSKLPAGSRESFMSFLPVQAAIGLEYFFGGGQEADAIGEASNAEVQIAREREARLQQGSEQARADLSPYTQAGAGGLQGLAGFQQAGEGASQQQQALAGLLGPEAQQAAIAALEGSPEFAAMLQQGEEAILQNASATGGLRGGNTQGALAQFRPALLSQLIEQQYARLGGLSQAGQSAAGNIAGMGQASAAGQAASGGQFGSLISDVMGYRGQAEAGGVIGQAQAQAQARRDAINMGLAGAGLAAKGATGGLL